MKKILGLLAICLSFPSLAQDAPLPPEQAFPMVYTLSPNGGIAIYFQITEDYKLYRNKFDVDSGAKITYISQGKEEVNEFLGKVEVMEGKAAIEVDTEKVKGNSFNLFYQGCKSDQFCYPIQMKEVKFKR